MNTKNENTTYKGDYTMKNTLVIDNFLIFDHAEIEINKFTVFIGPQASGKSIAAKLLYLFYLLPSATLTSAQNNNKKRYLCNGMVKVFSAVFPKHSWINQTFNITLQTNFGELSFSHEAGKMLTFKMSPHYDKILTGIFYRTNRLKKDEDVFWEFGYYHELENYVDKQDWGFVCKSKDILFTPAGRSFFATIEQNVFYFLYGTENLTTIDYFLKKFGMQYTQYKNSDFEYNRNEDSSFEKLSLKLLHGHFFRKNKKDYISRQLAGGNSVALDIRDCSSGQQELLPLLILATNTSYSYLIIEEPEAHIYPEAQAELMRYLVSCQYRNKSVAFLFTTHSPYVLTTLNNLAYAGVLEAKLKQKNDVEGIEKLDKIYTIQERIPEKSLSAYYFNNGKATNIIDEETGLINAEELDKISDITSEKFSELIDLKLQYDNDAEEEL